jgi:hypothetical protein
MTAMLPAKNALACAGNAPKSGYSGRFKSAATFL